jgi:8-oxo-dGTP pyrophosphatase MutT (NUDIX family)
METIEENSSMGVINAATIVCLRRCFQSSSDSCTWEVLLGQSEVKNWLRSSRDSTRIMRYPGEWKFPGGVVDEADRSLQECALRELKEEFMGLSPPSLDKAKLYFFNEKLTRPVQTRRYRMYNFVALEEENEWLNTQAIHEVNEALLMKKEEFHQYLIQDSFWDLDQETKMNLSPEIYRVQWFPIEKAIEMMQDSMVPFKVIHVDKWQEKEFLKYQVLKRDPMYQSMRVLMDIVALGKPEKLKQHLQQQPLPRL